jgi:hypothetical protein
MDCVGFAGPRQQSGESHCRILQGIDHCQIVLGLDVQNVGDIEGAAAVVLGILQAGEGPSHSLGVERRAVVELHVGPELEGPHPEVVGTGPRKRELGLGLAVVIEADQRIENQAGGDVGRRVVDADFQAVEARDIELEPDRERAALLLGHRRPAAEARDRSCQDGR